MILTSEPDGGNVRHWCNMLPGWRSAGARESSPQLTLCSCHRHSLQATCSGIMSCQWNLKNRQYSDAARGTCCAAYCVTEHLTPPPLPNDSWGIRITSVTFLGEILVSTTVIYRDSNCLLFIWSVCIVLLFNSIFWAAVRWLCPAAHRQLRAHLKNRQYKWQFTWRGSCSSKNTFCNALESTSQLSLSWAC